MPSTVTTDGIVIDLAAETLRDRSGAEVPLRAQSFAVLRYLFENAGRTVPKDGLMAAVWNDLAVTDDSLVQCIGDIRRALGDARQQIVRTVPRQGYRLELPAVASRVPVVAVLPFTDQDADRSLSRLGESVAGDIVATLTRAPSVAVVSGIAAFPRSEAPLDMRDVGAALGSDYVLDGSIRREGDTLRITAGLVESATGRHLWAGHFDGTGADHLALQDEIVARVVGALTGEQGEIVRAQYRAAWGRDAVALGEYEYYLRGHDFFVRFDGRGSNDRAGEIWREGLSRYPDSALLSVMLGWHHSLAGGLLWSDDPSAEVAAAGHLVRSVLARDELSGHVRHYAQWLFARVLMQEHDPGRSLAEARRSVELAPHDAFMLSALAQMLAEGGETRQSRAWLEQAERLAPGLAWLHNQTWGNLLRLQGDYAGSVSHYDRSGRLPEYHQLVRAISLLRLGQIVEARAAVARVRTAAPGITLAMWRESTRLADVAMLEVELADLAAAGLPP